MSRKPIVHEIRIQNQVIFLDPPIEYARSSWIRQLHDWLGVCSSLLGFEVKAECAYLQIEENPEFSVRDWAADAGSVVCRDDVHVIGSSRLFCVQTLLLTSLSVDPFHGQHPRTRLRPNRT